MRIGAAASANLPQTFDHQDKDDEDEVEREGEGEGDDDGDNDHENNYDHDEEEGECNDDDFEDNHLRTIKKAKAHPMSVKLWL